MKAECILFTKPGEVVSASCEVPLPASGEALVAVSYSAISPGTELRILRNEQSGIDLRTTQIIPGYGAIGHVIEVGPDVPQQLLGRRVICPGTQKANRGRAWGGHCAAAVCDASALIEVEEQTHFADALLSYFAGIPLRGVRLSKPSAGQKVAIVGLGFIGQIAARVFKTCGAEVIAAGVSSAQVELAKGAGVSAVLVGKNDLSALRKQLGPGAPIVADATGNPDVIALSLDLFAEKSWSDETVGGRHLVILGSYHGSIHLPYEKAFQNEVSVHFPRFTHARDVQECLGYVQTGKLSLKDIATTAVPFSEAPSLYKQLVSDRRSIVSGLIEWPQQSAAEPKKKIGWWPFAR